MKKILIASTLAILLVAGYIVGQVQFANSSTDRASKKSSSAASQGKPLINESSGSPRAGAEVDSVSKEIKATSFEYDMPDCGDLAACPNPNVGDPKGTKIIKEGSVEIKIARNSVNKNYDKVVTLISDGGYVESSTSSRRVTTLTVRIPSEKLDETLKALRKLGTVTNESINSYDRSYDAVDFDARLKIMGEREIVLSNALKNSSAAESFSIQEQLFTLHTQIETLKGEKALLDSQVALSTLTITLTEKGVKADDPGEKTMLGKAWTTAVDSLLTTVGGLLVVLAALLPFLLIGALIFFIARTIVNKKKTNKED